MCDQLGCDKVEDYQHRRDTDGMKLVDVRKDDLQNAIVIIEEESASIGDPVVQEMVERLLKCIQ